jgi:type IV secretory pathway component VirB8
MKLTGIEVPAETLSKKIEPNTVLMVISDEKGAVKVVKVDEDSIAENESLVRVASGCWVYIGGKRVWKDPCPN